MQEQNITHMAIGAWQGALAGQHDCRLRRQGEDHRDACQRRHGLEMAKTGELKAKAAWTDELLWPLAVGNSPPSLRRCASNAL
jgi:hypothetical protein